MILKFLLLNNEKNLVFQRNFVEKEFFSEFQLKTIEETYSKLLNIVEILSKNPKNENLTKKRFTITNLWLTIYKSKKYYFIFITPALYFQNKLPLDLESEFNHLIEQIDLLVNHCSMNEPNFDLSLNKYFERTVLGFIKDFNLAEITKYETIKFNISKALESSLEARFKKSLNKKYLILGVGAVGKTSIISQFFDNWNLEQLQNIKPTIFKTINNVSDTYVEHNFTMIDLGGQEIYLQQHLSDNNLFKNLNTIIFVIDLQNEKKKISTQKYFQEVLNILHENNEKPFISVFLHKFDPELHLDLDQNIHFWFNWLDQSFNKFSLPFSYYLTSILDNSAREALARTLLLTIPNWFLALIIKKDLIYRSFNSLIPILSDIEKQFPTVTNDYVRSELFNSSVIFGQSITKIILQNWIAHLMKDETYSINFGDIKSVETEIKIEFNEEAGLTELKFKCPLLEKKIDPLYTSNKDICSITHGLLTGLCQFTGLGKITIVETQIRNNSEFCSFTILM